MTSMLTSMFARSRRVAAQAAGGTCQSCDADLPAGGHFCACCGSPAQAIETAALPDHDGTMRRHAELLGAWLDADVRRFRPLRWVLLGGVLLVAVGAYVVREEEEPVQRVRPRASAGAPMVSLGAARRDSGFQRDSSLGKVATVDLATRPPVSSNVVYRSVTQPRARTAVTVKRIPPAAPGLLQILVTPWAWVSIDGRDPVRRARGTDTLTPLVSHRLRFARPGFGTIDTVVSLRPGEERLWEVHMESTTP